MYIVCGTHGRTLLQPAYNFALAEHILLLLLNCQPISRPGSQFIIGIYIAIKETLL